MRLLKFLLLLCCSSLLTISGRGQIIKDESKWSFEAKKKSDSKYEFIVHVKIPKGWHIYAGDPGTDPSLTPTKIVFDNVAGVKYIGGVKEKGRMISETIIDAGGVVNTFRKKVDFVQEAEVNGAVKVTGSYSYQICSDQMCLAPITNMFELSLK